MVPPWWVASLIASLAVAGLEYANRVGQFSSFGRALIVTGPLILLTQWGIFYSWRDAPSMLKAWALFFLLNIGFRLVSVQWFVGEGVSFLALGGALLIVLGAFLMKVGS